MNKATGCRGQPGKQAGVGELEKEYRRGNLADNVRYRINALEILPVSLRGRKGESFVENKRAECTPTVYPA